MAIKTVSERRRHQQELRATKQAAKSTLDSHGKRIMLRQRDVPDMLDALFYGSEVPHRLGFVEMYANSKGREKINDLFPEAHIDWKPLPSGCPDQWAGWQTFEINLPEVIKAIPTNLPMDLTQAEGSESPRTPDAFACLLAIGVKRGGARAAVAHGVGETSSLTILTPAEH
jgi:hypothetical protein